MLGNVFIRYRDDQVFQIDSGTSSFRTGDGITTSSSDGTTERFLDCVLKKTTRN